MLSLIKKNVLMKRRWVHGSTTQSETEYKITFGHNCVCVLDRTVLESPLKKTLSGKEYL